MDERIEKAQRATFLTDFDKTHHGYEARLEVVPASGTLIAKLNI